MISTFSTHQLHKVWSHSRAALCLACLLFSLGLSISTVAFAVTDAALTIPRPYPEKLKSHESEYIRQSRYLTMRDGVKIAITVYLPTDGQQDRRRPTILRQTRYWRSIEYRWPLSIVKDDLPRGLIGTYATRFLNKGYVWVDVDVRGSGASFGSRPYAYTPQEIHDGAEIVDWIIQQSWSNGSVGALGISYGGATAEMLLVNQHPAVKAVAPLFSGFDIYPEIAFPGGIHLTWFTQTWTHINNKLDHNELPFRGWLTKAFVHGVSPVDTDHDRSLLMNALSEHRTNWSPYHESLNLTFRDDVPASPTIPNIDALSSRSYMKEIAGSGSAIYSYSGWFDGAYHLAAIQRHLAHHNPYNKLIIGPWDHGGKRNISPFNTGPSAFDHQGELLKFFDYHLQDQETGVTDEAPIHYFTMGEERWKASQTWPPKAIRTSYFFDTDGQLSTARPPQDMANDQYVVNPHAGTGHQSRWNTLVGQSLPTPYADRFQEDTQLLSYTSHPLKQDMEVTGHPILTIFLSATTTDATVFAYLDDIDNTGKVSYVTEGLLRALHRKVIEPSPPHIPPGVPHRTFTRQHASPLMPGEIAKLSFDLLPTSYQFKQGHRIRLSIAGADKDHFAILPGENPIFTISRSHRFPSHLDLPIVP